MDPPVIDEILENLKNNPDFEILWLDRASMLSLPGLEIDTTHRKVIVSARKSYWQQRDMAHSACLCQIKARFSLMRDIPESLERGGFWECKQCYQVPYSKSSGEIKWLWTGCFLCNPMCAWSGIPPWDGSRKNGCYITEVWETGLLLFFCCVQGVDLIHFLWKLILCGIICFLMS